MIDSVKWFQKLNHLRRVGKDTILMEINYLHQIIGFLLPITKTMF